MAPSALAVTPRDSSCCVSVAFPARSASSSSAPRAVPASAVKPASNSVSAMSNPLEHRGPVSIETQKQVAPGCPQFTPMNSACSRRARYAGSAIRKTRSCTSIACRSQERSPTKA